jgi:uncharacterized protein
MESTNNLPHLNAAEIRVLGSLIEKSRTTPDYYPMTVNAITAACNQKTSRYPVVDYDEETVIAALAGLKAHSLVATAVGGTSRTTKYKHNFNTVYNVTPSELAILCLLFLRGPQTPGELNTNSARLHTFMSLREVIESLHHLMHLQSPFVKELSKKPGQKEVRFIHLFGDAPDESEQPPQPHPKNEEDVQTRLSVVETELAELKKIVDSLVKKIYG